MAVRSLAARVSLSFLAGHLIVLAVAFLALKPIMLSSDESIQFGPSIAIEAAAGDLRRAPSGRPVLAGAGRLAQLRQGNPALWLVARTAAGTASVGDVPAEALAMPATLPPGLDMAELRLRSRPGSAGEVAIERHETRGGPALIMAGGVDPGAVGWDEWLGYLVQSDIIWAVPLFLVLTVPAVLIATPMALRGLRGLAGEATVIGPARPDARLSVGRTPRELLPLTAAINAALDRLSGEIERKRRFIADVSHELRTPLAVLGLRIADLAPGEDRREVQRSHRRLTEMVGQMLDAERLSLAGPARQPVDLAGVARSVVADLAPMAIEAGYDVALTGAAGPVVIDGDAHAIGRAIANLFGNAVAHGGGRGPIEVRVGADATIDVLDDGPGVAADARDRVFDPFFRERRDRDGCGLGLHLVQEIMRAHGGHASILDGTGGRFRLAFPLPGEAVG